MGSPSAPPPRHPGRASDSLVVPPSPFPSLQKFFPKEQICTEIQDRGPWTCGGGHRGSRQVLRSIPLSAPGHRVLNCLNSDSIHHAGTSAPAAKYDGHDRGGTGIGTRFAGAGLVPSVGQGTEVGLVHSRNAEAETAGRNGKGPVCGMQTKRSPEAPAPFVFAHQREKPGPRWLRWWL